MPWTFAGEPSERLLRAGGTAWLGWAAAAVVTASAAADPTVTTIAPDLPEAACDGRSQIRDRRRLDEFGSHSEIGGCVLDAGPGQTRGRGGGRFADRRDEGGSV